MFCVRTYLAETLRLCTMGSVDCLFELFEHAQGWVGSWMGVGCAALRWAELQRLWENANQLSIIEVRFTHNLWVTLMEKSPIEGECRLYEYCVFVTETQNPAPPNSTARAAVASV